MTRNTLSSCLTCPGATRHKDRRCSSCRRRPPAVWRPGSLVSELARVGNLTRLSFQPYPGAPLQDITRMVSGVTVDRRELLGDWLHEPPPPAIDPQVYEDAMADLLATGVTELPGGITVDYRGRGA